MNSKARSGGGSSWARLKAHSKTVRRRLEELVGESSEAAHADSIDPIGGARALEEELRKWRELCISAVDRLQPCVDKLRADRTDFLEHLEDRLRRELIRQGHEVFGDTSPLVVDGIVHIEIDKAAMAVSINSEPLEDLSILGISRAVHDRASTLQKDGTKPIVFLDQLADAYDRELRLGGKAPGTQVPALSLLGHILMARQSAGFRANPSARSFREYTREHFRADLYNLLRSGKLDHHAARFRYASGSDTLGAVFMFVPALERTAHVGRVWFEPT
ncbi:hypothetical protein AnaeK_3941 [Anaeromyxobacter sp. K]|uniref:hypothetical protein n=1 Tax=Anaeromyxobacter sp. (strain K) TaxID=447217 RepID=UPI00015F88E6|nr:hypothetical protein [Anaeromyxobacter sp. K]ACG75148.1 hypothetical protein AnaeK_3941 [Anaeromyxobacter sp. K]